MSRIGKKPVALPQGVTASVDGQTVTAKGPKGELQFVVNDEVLVKLEDGEIAVEPRTQAKTARCQMGHVAHADRQHRRRREGRLREEAGDQGVGYRAAMQGKNLKLSLGFSHEVVYETPEGITHRRAEADRNHRHRHRQAAGRPGRGGNPRVPRPEPYKGKGVRYAGE